MRTRSRLPVSQPVVVGKESHDVAPIVRYRGPPPNAYLHPTHTLSKIQSPHSKMDNVPYNDRIEFAITNLKSQA
jgi:hypothetical protein